MKAPNRPTNNRQRLRFSRKTLLLASKGRYQSPKRLYESFHFDLNTRKKNRLQDGHKEYVQTKNLTVAAQATPTNSGRNVMLSWRWEQTERLVKWPALVSLSLMLVGSTTSSVPNKVTMQAVTYRVDRR